MKTGIVFFIWLTSLAGFAKERAAIYPFDVTVAGETAVIEGNPASAIFAKLKKPVAKDAEVKLGMKEPAQVIVNVFSVDDKGVPIKGVEPKVIFVTKGTSFRLDGTMDKSVLADGKYGMNIVSSLLGTSRVLFEVGEAKAASGGESQKTPEAALQMVFDAAKSGKLEGLKVLLPPGGGEDGDVRNVCGVSMAPEKDQKEFREYFEKGAIQGKARIDEKAGTAEVDFLFGPTGKKSETMNLVRKGELWYLSSF